MDRPSLEYVESLAELVLSYEDLASLTVGDIHIVKNPSRSFVEQMISGQEPFPDAPSYDDLTKDYVDSTEGPNDEG